MITQRNCDIGYNNESDDEYLARPKLDYELCDKCGCQLYNGDGVYEFGNDFYCEDCGEERLREIYLMTLEV